MHPDQRVARDLEPVARRPETARLPARLQLGLIAGVLLEQARRRDEVHDALHPGRRELPDDHAALAPAHHSTVCEHDRARVDRAAEITGLEAQEDVLPAAPPLVVGGGSGARSSGSAPSWWRWWRWGVRGGLVRIAVEPDGVALAEGPAHAAADTTMAARTMAMVRACTAVTRGLSGRATIKVPRAVRRLESDSPSRMDVRSRWQHAYQAPPPTQVTG